MSENTIMKPVKNCSKCVGGGVGDIRKINRNGEFDQSTLYAHMEISQ
jgi:hypothetical protein